MSGIIAWLRNRFGTEGRDGGDFAMQIYTSEDGDVVWEVYTETSPTPSTPDVFLKVPPESAEDLVHSLDEAIAEAYWMRDNDG